MRGIHHDTELDIFYNLIIVTSIKHIDVRVLGSSKSWVRARDQGWCKGVLQLLISGRRMMRLLVGRFVFACIL